MDTVKMSKAKKVAYPPNWKSEIVPRINARAGNRCERCGVANHLIGYRDRSGGFVDLTSFAHFDNNKQVVHYKQVTTKLWDTLPNGATLIKIILTTAHLDHDPENWGVSYERLKAFCQRCHLNNDRAHNIRKRKYGSYHKQPKLWDSL